MSLDVGDVEALTDEERRSLHDGVCSRHRDTSPGVYVCRPCESAGDAAVERIIAARLEVAEAYRANENATLVHQARAELAQLVEELRELADDLTDNVDWSPGRSSYGDNEAWETAGRRLRAALDRESRG